MEGPTNVPLPLQSSTEIDENWRDRAACLGADPGLFYPEKGDKAIEAKDICDSCEVKEICLEEALADHEKRGIWGGTNEKERRRIVRERRIARVAIY